MEIYTCIYDTYMYAMYTYIWNVIHSYIIGTLYIQICISSISYIHICSPAQDLTHLCASGLTSLVVLIEVYTSALTTAMDTEASARWREAMPLCLGMAPGQGTREDIDEAEGDALLEELLRFLFPN